MTLTFDQLASPLRLAGQLLAGAKHDMAFVAITTFGFSLLAHLARASGKLLKVIERGFLIIACIGLIAALLNITIVDYLSSPLNYRWFYYADFGFAADAHAAIGAVLTLDVLGSIVIGVAFLFTITHFIRIGISAAANAWPARWLTLVSLSVVCSMGLTARPYWGSYSISQAHIANPILHFLQSIAVDPGESLLSLPTEIGSDDFRVHSDRVGSNQPRTPNKRAEVRNVLIYVMESVPAAYLDTYGSPFGVTPTIRHYADRSTRFANIYAHAPSSQKSLLSILTSTYPLISYKTMAKEIPDANLASLSSVLKSRGYQTSFFQSADVRYAGTEDFLRSHQFDVIRDFRSVVCNTEFYDKAKANHLDYSVDDLCTSISAGKWIETASAAPFFAVVWTNMTHFPYFVSGPEKVHTQSNPEQNRFLNALYRGDQALGHLLRVLEENQLSDSTLVVVTADHGEAFGEHGHRIHGASVYEESVHVPLILITPHVEPGKTLEVVGGHIDIAPTIADILGIPSEALWQGNSLLSEERPPRTYFFSSQSDLQFGYRILNMKYSFNATANRCESYDLTADPKELHNLLISGDARCEHIKARLAAWVQYQKGLTQRISKQG